jgi:dTDP-4-dehydrorhamnose 3,5-epimerase
MNHPTTIPEPKRDGETVTDKGEFIKRLIEGVIVRPAATIPDERGTLTEIINPAWQFGTYPVVYGYQFTINPGRIKGWAIHYETDDQYFHNVGRVKIVLYDDRKDAPTYRMINEFCFTEHNRSFLTIPRGVYHAIQNIGTVEALLLNFPSQPYDYKNPDKYRLPLDTDYIPYRFESTLGW